jgi:hypothetical protein
MSWTDEYTSERAFWVSLRTHAARQAKANPTQPSQELLRQFIIQRFIARIFQQPGAPWVVGGGTGMLIRLPGTRATQDLDLTTTQPRPGDRTQVLADIAPYTGANDLDPFAYTITGDQPFTGAVRGTKLRVTTDIGAERAATFGVDVAADEIPVSDIEHRHADPVVPGIRGLSPIPAVPLFPLASQIADKVVGVMFRDKQNRSANRYRDLADLALYAGDIDINAGELRHALRNRAQRREQPTPTHIEIPDSWQAGYRRIVRTTTLPDSLHNAKVAGEAVGAWLNPILSGNVDDEYVWDHTAGAWHDPAEPATRPGKIRVRPHMRSGAAVTDYFRRSPRRG